MVLENQTIDQGHAPASTVDNDITDSHAAETENNIRVSNLLLITQTGKPIMTDNLNTSPIADDDDSFQPDIYLIQDIGISLILKKLTF